MIQHVLLSCLPLVASALASAKPLALLNAKPLKLRRVPVITCGLLSCEQKILDAASVNSTCCDNVQCLLCQKDNR